ncbi:MAG: biopolymer transporter ExbD [Phycisphaerales bacterium]|nr:MAG: biopolymer transporter ExbD [Phycisphaerales bacterium]
MTLRVKPYDNGRPRPNGDAEVVHFRPRRKRVPREMSALGLNITPMIDMTFLLLIFFVVTTTFDRPEGVLASKLPQQSSRYVPLPLSPIVVRVHPQGADRSGYDLQIDNVSAQPGDFVELAALLQELQTRPGFDADTPVVIMAAAGVRWDHVVNCWNAAVRVKYKNVLFGEE